MVKFLSSVISFVIFIAVVVASSSADSNHDDDATAIVDQKTALELNYAVHAYECDSNSVMLEGSDRAKKVVATIIRICFVPNEEAIEAGASIDKVNSFVWSTTTRAGDEHVLEAVINGKGDNMMSAITCKDGGKICSLESMLGPNFYQDTGSVIGIGEVTLTKGAGTVPVNRDIFQLNFEVKFTNDDGTEMSEEEKAALFEKVNEHNAAIESGEDRTGNDPTKTNEEVKEEL
jgi:hypothetical protein